MSSALSASNYDPNGSYYASAITALDTHKIRVQSTNTSSTLATAFSLDKGHKLTSLSWGVSPNVESKLQNKRRRLSQSFTIESQVLAVGLNKGSILIYSPTANEIQGKLENPNASSINDYTFSSITNSGWSVDIGQNVIEWDLILFKVKQQFQFKEAINVIKVIKYEGKPHLLLGSQSIYLVDLETKEIVKTFPGHISPIHTIIPFKDQTHFVTAAHGDRFINIYSLEGPSSTVLVAQSNVLSVSGDDENLAVVTEDGIVEYFSSPLSSTATSTPSKRRAQKSKQSNFKIDLRRPNSDILKIEDSYIDPEFIVITWLEEGSIPYFEKIKVQDLTVSTTITRPKPAIQAKNHSLYGQDIAAPKAYNESSATVTSGDNFKFLDNKEVEQFDEHEDDDNAPSLAERLDSMKVESTGPKKKQGRATTGSLVVLLTQALRSNDHALLESVLANRDENVLKTTIQRLDTSFAVTLLERLAERIARQTNRQGQLNIWVKWVMIIHGGYLVNVPNLAKSLSSLHSTLSRRANTLPRLLELQGRLDVLHSQFEINKTNKQLEIEEESDIDSDVEYVEELDDANLLDDEDIQDDEEILETEDGYMSLDESSGAEGELVEQADHDEPVQEEGYSDEEVNGFAEESAEENEDEQELLRKRIAKLKSNQSKRK